LKKLENYRQGPRLPLMLTLKTYLSRRSFGEGGKLSSLLLDIEDPAVLTDSASPDSGVGFML